MGSSWYFNNIGLSTFPPIEIDNTIISFVLSVKNLGVFFRPNLSWDKHAEHKHICRNVYATLQQFINQIKNHLLLN